MQRLAQACGVNLNATVTILEVAASSDKCNVICLFTNNYSSVGTRQICNVSNEGLPSEMLIIMVTACVDVEKILMSVDLQLFMFKNIL